MMGLPRGPSWKVPARYASFPGVGTRDKRGSAGGIFPVRVRALCLLLILLLLTVSCSVAKGVEEVRSVLQPSTSAQSQPPSTTAMADEPREGKAGNEASPQKDEDDPGSEKGAQDKDRTAAATEPTKGCDDLRVLVDRSHTLPPDYAPDDLVQISDYGVPTLGSDTLLRREAAEHLGSLVAAAAADGQELVVSSAYRSYEDQAFSHARLRSIYGPEADAVSAAPGHSQHQLGTAVDFTNAAASYEVWQVFGQTTASAWLRANASAYGFVLAYPRGGSHSGYAWEPWHYRYVGVETARRWERSGGSLQEFLVEEGVMPRC